MPDKNPRVVVCGAGVIGAAIAYHLALRGVAATVIERTGVACAASGKAGGFLARDWCDGSPLGALARTSYRMHADLSRALGTDYGYRAMTTFGVSADGRAAVRAVTGPRWLDGRGAVYAELGSSDNTAQVHPRLFTEALMDAARKRGATLISGCVQGLDVGAAPARVRAVRVDGAWVPADAVVIAMGPWSDRAGRWLPLPPVGGLKGFSITLKPDSPLPAEALFVDYVDDDGAHASPELFPRPDGEVYLCGLSDDLPLPEDPSRVTVDSRATAVLRRAAGALSSSLAGAPVQSENACYRPVCADALPLMGAVPGVSGAFIATGHNCWGILNAPASGAAMAELITRGEASCVDLRAFSPARFSEPRRRQN